MRVLMACLSLMLLSACSTFSWNKADVYEQHRLGEEAYAQHEDARAEGILRGLLRQAPNDAEAWFMLGNLYARTNRPEQAIDAYQKTLMLNRNDARAWHNLGVVRLRQGWAAMITAYDATKPGDPLHDKAEGIIGAMENIPLDGMKRGNAKDDTDAVLKTEGGKKE